MGNDISYKYKKISKSNLNLILPNLLYILVADKTIVGTIKIDINKKINIEFNDNNDLLVFSNCKLKKFSEKLVISLKCTRCCGTLVITLPYDNNYYNNTYKVYIKYEKQNISPYDDPAIFDYDLYMYKKNLI